MRKLRAKHIRWLVFVIAVVTALDLPILFLNGIMIWFSPMIMMERIMAFNGIVIFHLISITVLIVIILRKRWICRYVCPSGVVCDLSSDLSTRIAPKQFHLNRYFVIIGLILAVFGIPLMYLVDPFNMFHASLEFARTGFGKGALLKLSGIVFLFLFSIFMPRTWCNSICPLGGLQELLYNFHKKLSIPPQLSVKSNKNRRIFLAGLTGVAAGIMLPGIKRNNKKLIRPPFSLREDQFNVSCSRCGNCISVCPTGILHPVTAEGTLEQFLSPMVKFEDSYCLESCNACGKICPTGSIRKFTVADKKSQKMGIARIDTENCLLQKNQECNLCKQYCPYDAIDYRRININEKYLPLVSQEKCVGCGACEIICPVKVIEITIESGTS